MVTARQLCLAGFVVLGSAACAGRQNNAEGMIPVARKLDYRWQVYGCY